jgi:predicted transposase YbfD/YdcC
VPDPRQARGQRHPWRHLLLISAAGLASNHHSARALAQWAQFHAATLRAILPNLRRLPSESTILRALRSMDVQRLEHQLAQLVLAEPTTPDEADAAPAPARTCVQGQAVDGKWVRTATAHGARTLLLSVVHHHTGRTLAQAKVAAQHTEVTACQHLLHGRELRGTVTTMDAGLTHRGRAQHIRRQGGHYLMVVKQNHPVMRDEIALFFTAPRLPVDAHERYDCATSVTKGHGRLEVRTLACLTGQCADWQWPDVAQVLRRTCERVVCKTGKRTVTVSYYQLDRRCGAGGRARTTVARALDARKPQTLCAGCDARGRPPSDAHGPRATGPCSAPKCVDRCMAGAGLAQHGGCRASVWCVRPAGVKLYWCVAISTMT